MSISRRKIRVSVNLDGREIASFKSRSEDETDRKLKNVLKNNAPRGLALTAPTRVLGESNRTVKVLIDSVPRKSRGPICPLPEVVLV